MPKTSDMFLWTIAALLVLILVFGLALLLREFSDGAFGWNAATGPWVQAVFTIAGIAAAIWVPWRVHRETVEREDRSRNRMIRSYLHENERQWELLVAEMPSTADRARRFRNILSIEPWGTDFDAKQLERLHTHCRRAVDSANKLHNRAAAARLNYELLVHLDPRDWDALTEARTVARDAAQRLHDAADTLNLSEPPPEISNQAAALLDPVENTLFDAQQAILTIFNRFNLMQKLKDSAQITTLDRQNPRD